jgi:hypothetical protein
VEKEFMGFFGGNNEDNEGNELIQQQINENARQIEESRRSLAERRLEIIKSQGAQSWQPGSNPPPPNRRIVAEKQVVDTAKKYVPGGRLS